MTCVTFEGAVDQMRRLSIKNGVQPRRDAALRATRRSLIRKERRVLRGIGQKRHAALLIGFRKSGREPESLDAMQLDAARNL